LRVLLVSEGAGELGGALETLIRRLLPDVELEVETDRVASRQVRIHMTGRGYLSRARAWLRNAEIRGFDALILVIDRDEDSSRVKQINEAQDDAKLTQLSRALGVAIEKFDAWMLADEGALTTVLGYSVTCQPDPESTRDPKQTVYELRSQTSVDLSLPELYAGVADEINLDLLEKRCRRGFGPFAERVRALRAG
jgi:hypothetical protein